MKKELPWKYDLNNLEDEKDKLKNEKDKELIELKHKFKMEELEYERETWRKTHEWKLEEQRIKTAEIRKDRERQSIERWANNNEKNSH